MSVELVKSGTRRTLRDDAIDLERALACELHVEIVGHNGAFGETLIEDLPATGPEGTP